MPRLTGTPLLLAALLGVAGGCVPEDGFVSGWPAHFPPPLDTPHVVTDEGVALGRRLFFDVRLSSDRSISCASCHEPARAFSDGVARSNIGVSGVLLDRNSPSLANLAWVDRLFWDGGIKNLESLVLTPLTSPDEMNRDPFELLEELGDDPGTVAAFEAAFPGEGLSLSTLMRALGQYMRTLVSAESPYDAWLTGRAPRALGAAETRGLAVVERECARCHAGVLFTDADFHNQGLDGDLEWEDAEDPRRGRGRISFDPRDEGKFRTPSLRNLRFTAPYMHDGRFETLDEVLAHYRFGMRPSATIDPGFLRADGTLGVSMRDDEASDVLAFLETLNDARFVERHLHDAAE